MKIGVVIWSIVALSMVNLGFLIYQWIYQRLRGTKRTLKHLDHALDIRWHGMTNNLVAQSDRLFKQLNEHSQRATELSGKHQLAIQKSLNDVREQLAQSLSEYRQSFDKHQMDTTAQLQQTLIQSLTKIHEQTIHTLAQHAESLGKRVDKLTSETDHRLKEISGQVEKHLSEGFEKTTATFQDVIKRLALIDEAQKKITELSSNVVSLQEVLSDKKSRGTFGEVQLGALISNVIPKNHYQEQYSLTNGKRADCVLFLPQPTGNVVIDAKFPLENYQRMTNPEEAEITRREAESQFKLDIRKHINDIASKYIIPGQTSDGAMMFIPAEAIFAEIHANYPDLVEYAQHSKVWMVSPTTMMAVLTTARAVLKDAATRKQVHIIQDHLRQLAKDFSRFEDRMDKLAQHIHQAQNDVDQVHTSAKKITSRFGKIEQVELEQRPEKANLLIEE